LTAGPNKSAGCFEISLGGLAVMGLERELVVADDLLGHGGYFGDLGFGGEVDDGKFRWCLLGRGGLLIISRPSDYLYIE
jgi:hypothetical protein